MKRKIIIPNKNYNPQCGDHEIASGNSDSNCFRERFPYAKRLIRKKPELCKGCVYNGLMFDK